MAKLARAPYRPWQDLSHSEYKENQMEAMRRQWHNWNYSSEDLV